MLLDERMSNLEEQYEELKKMVKQEYNPELHSKSSTTRTLESWRYGDHPGDTVHRPLQEWF